MPGGFQEVKVHRFRDNGTHRMVVRSALRTGRLYPTKCSWYSFLLEAVIDPRAIVRSEGFYVDEKSTDTSWDRISDLPFACSHVL